MENVIRDYSNWSEYRKAAGVMPASSHQGDKNWCGTNTVGEALAIADKGWPDGMARVRAIAIPALAACHAAIHADGGWQYDVTGADYDVGEYLTGAPECWLAPETPASKPVVTIMANIVSSAGIPKAALEMRGAAVCALTMALQTAGYAVRVFAVEGMNIGSKDIWHRVCLTDDMGGPLDTDRLLFALAHPSAARQIGYCLGVVMAGMTPDSGHMIGWPSGGPTAKPPGEWKSDLYLQPPFLDAAEWDSPESVAAWVANTYAKLSLGESST